ncbi:MAG TPA: SMP-30/gluconolactonase/LRE family protein [Lacisediminihabitans sp.]|uniref:SMP-30/gluconolactonase/LRE family protein n=1 Tax=Lacisediminihabitans sp. TaxID=2787631 RepID=UPI002EDB1FD8
MAVIRGLPGVFRDAKAVLAEGIVWDEAGDLLWCDITAGLLHRSPIDGPPDGSGDTVVRMPPPLASFALAASGGYVVSLGDRVVSADGSGTVTAELAAIDHGPGILRLNEGKCDPYGRWVTGSMSLTGEPDGAMYSVTAGGELRLLRGGLGVANGFEWSLDDSEMFFTDTSVGTIYRAPYGRDGGLGEVKPFHSGLAHDGLTIDAEGCLWSAIYGGGRVVRYRPDGREDLSVELPVPNVTSVAFGGAGRSTLFVASARENLTEAQLEEHPLSGAIFAVETSTNGRRARLFGDPE